MKIYKKIVFDKNDNVIEEESFEYTGEVAKAGGSTFKKLVIIAVIVTAVVVLGPASFGSMQGMWAGLNPMLQKVLISAATSLIAGVIGAKLVPKIDMPNMGTSIENGVNVTAKAPTAPYRIVYGSTRVGGTIVYASTTSSTNEFLHMVIVLAGHEVADIPTIYFGDDIIELETLSNDSNGIAIYTPTSSDQYNGKVIIKKHFGDPAQLADANLVADVAQWTVDHKISNKAYIYIKLTFDSDVFPNGVPNISAIVNGKRCYDIRGNSFTASASSVSTANNTITISAHGLSNFDRATYDANGQTAIGNLTDGQLYYVIVVDANIFQLATNYANCVAGTAIDLTSVTGSTTQKFFFTISTDNPALIIRDYLTDNTIGMKCSASEIDDDKFINTANICDELVTVINPAGTEKRFTCNGAFTLASTPKVVIENFVTTMGGILLYSNGNFKLVPATYQTPVVSLSESNFRSGIAINTRVSKKELFNAVKGLYSEPANQYQPQNYPILTNSSYEAEDNGERIYQEFDYPFTNSSRMCQRLSNIQLLKVRNQISFSSSFDLKAFKLTVGDTVNISNARMGWTNKTFQVIDWGFSLNGNGNLQVDCQFKETASAIYDYTTANYSTISSGKSTNLPNSKSVSAPTAINLTDELVQYNDGTVIVKLVINLVSANDNFTELYEVEIKQLTDANGDPVTDDFKSIGRGSRLKYEFLNVIDKASYQVRAKGINIFGVNSATITADHTVVGLSAPPPNVENFSCNIVGLDAFLSWDAVDVLDLSYYELRYSNLTSDVTWGNSVFMVKKVSRPATSVVVPAKTGAYLIKARDKLGNPSIDATIVYVAVDTIGNYNALTSSTQNPDFDGDRVNIITNYDSEPPGLMLDGSELFDSPVVLFDSITDRNFDSGTINGNLYRTGYYYFDQTIDVGSRVRTNITAGISQTVIDRDGFFDAVAGDFDARSGNFDGDSEANCASELQIALSADNISFTPWQTFVVGDYLGRYFKFRLVLTSVNGSATPVVTALSVTLDMEDRIEAGNNIVSGASTKTVTFTQAYLTVPALGFAVQDMASGDTYTLTNKTNVGFDVAFTNTGGSGVSRTFDYIAKGY